MADAGFWVDGESFDYEDFTFRELKLIRQIIAELGGDPEDPADADFLPACVVAFKRRKEPDYSADKALDMRPADLVKPVRPTKRATPARK